MWFAILMNKEGSISMTEHIYRRNQYRRRTNKSDPYGRLRRCPV